jgi:hypothetical protein
MLMTDHEHCVNPLTFGGQKQRAKRRLDVLIGVRVEKPTDLLDTTLYRQNFVVRWTSLLSAL